MPKEYPFQPDYAVPPGATVKETLEAKGLSQADLAVRSGMTEKTISQIINGIAPISHETAGKLEMVLGIPARFWNARELTYRESLFRIEEQGRLEKDAEWLEEIPLKLLMDRGWVKPGLDRRSLVREALRFFGVSSVDAWREAWERPCVQYRGAKAQKHHPGHVAAWLRMGEIAAESVRCQPYNAGAFRDALAQIRALTTQPAAVWRKEVVRLCAEAGVAVVLVREVPSAGVSGVAKWITKDKALIQLSLKYKTDDQFWFSFFHEAGHILLHGKKEVFVEDGRLATDEEREADQFARDMLVPRARIRELAYLKTKSAICNFAQSLQVSPGIVVGRLQHDKLLPPSHCNDLKKKLQWAEPPTGNE
jgi:transcriptional regulator with XRE-family HTH domain